MSDWIKEALKPDEQLKSEAIQDAHNKGQSDASKGVDSPPVDAFAGAISRFASELRDAYYEGQDNVKSQK